MDKKRVGIGDVVMVRLALLPGTSEEDQGDESRRCRATVAYVERTGGSGEPSGAPGSLKPNSTHSLNVDVRMTSSQQTLRLTSVPFYDEEPEDARGQHVAYPVPEPEEK